MKYTRKQLPYKKRLPIYSAYPRVQYPESESATQIKETDPTGQCLPNERPKNGSKKRNDPSGLPQALTPYKGMLHTITSDNGKEFAFQQLIAKELSIDLYFARPIIRGKGEQTKT